MPCFDKKKWIVVDGTDYSLPGESPPLASAGAAPFPSAVPVVHHTQNVVEKRGLGGMEEIHRASKCE